MISSNYRLQIIFFLLLFQINFVLIHITFDKLFPVLASLPLECVLIFGGTECVTKATSGIKAGVG